ncbi:glutathione S-transferase family protein [Mesorhizobium sp. M7A.T.Ca.TU.009.01.3.2]|jgi:glutathione S-transferase|uniref:glutathione S-transferase family protein n=1 Tax=unclassified Mesorhizobium TaxID=325217 RepID=UPI000FCBDD12|nr:MULTISPECIES: glutathione S-transferase family protein [unclassified Mesorhizobium]RUU08596.1 glutathione S-transferase family protein [Mesorhizobium sp. M7A.T.Ca.TU.009.01.3.2]RUU56843.1 glutathione S-transferase family protein [Mesorhizobium sp. M7A.T.Ca.TU.009.01.1.1]RUU76120.1 glutathione S-transferase family protein [Mesorhizobium sp. M7A.T.Ca.TU.009.01.1.2]RUV03442.1 glutathione S-transferase family protein [Mesorhizobium sp. M7A.T.Ca.TU.009.01.3.1]RUV47736.1 glutathione S-transferase
MGKPIVYGAEYSVYVRIVRLVLAEKGIDYELVPVDVFAAEGVPAWYFEHHPFGRIPAFCYDGFRLFETNAIARYIDEAFEGPALQPADARGRARMGQIIGMLDAYGYRAMVWDVAVERLEKAEPDSALIAGGLAQAETVLKVLRSLKPQGPWLLGDQLTLADLHAAPIIAYFVKVTQGRDLLARFADIRDWYTRVADRASFTRTEKVA